jgi:predicted glycogen debranching enzyme
MPLLHFDRDQCRPLELALTREWLETDGLGGYASSTVVMCNVRRFHGLLVAPLPTNPTRHVFLSRFEETLHREDRSLALSMARYAGTFAPDGHKSLEEFALDPFPHFVHRLGRTTVHREVLMVRGAPLCLVRYRIDTEHRDIELRLRPLLACRPADALTFENLDLDPRCQRLDNGIRCQPYAALPAVHLTIGGSDAHFEADPVWYRGIEYPNDLARGYDGHEDQFSPGVLHVPLQPGGDVVVAATIEAAVADPRARWRAESERRRARQPQTPAAPRAIVAHTADSFLVRTAGPAGPRSRLGIVAGYPWFCEWGRDAFVALPGLTLARDADSGLAACREVLIGALPFLRDGLLPNVFGREPADSQYDSADAALWFARAVRLYMRAGAPTEEVLEMFHPALQSIAEGYASGSGRATALGIGTDAQGLVHAGGPGLNPTWMDARTAAGPVTPRHGCAVEINALWFFLLRFLEALAELRGDAKEMRGWREQRRRVGRTFLERFWISEERYLADVWRDGAQDRSVRPNMVIAAALEWSPLTRGRRTDVVRRAEAELLTARGLRTLRPGDPAYHGRYQGNRNERDAAYHQGTVWPWLIGFYCEAHLRALAMTRKNVQQLRELLDGFAQHLEEHGLLHVSEVFDGDPPHRAGGACAQAWSSAELLRAYRLLDEAQP